MIREDIMEYFQDELLVNSLVYDNDATIDEIRESNGPNVNGPTDLGPIVIGTYHQFVNNFVEIYQYWHERYMNNLFPEEIDEPMNYEQCRDHYLSNILRFATMNEINTYPHLEN